tara:strand:- start:118086 stop:120002 length:1917 start_codon:yes stop_codon:yes gene_type:complete
MTKNTVTHLNQFLFKNPEYSCVQISPKASYFSYVQYKNDMTQLILKPRASPGQLKSIVKIARRVSQYWWTASEKNIIYLEDRLGQGPVLVCLNIKNQISTDIVNRKMIKSVSCSAVDSNLIHIEMKEYKEHYFHVYEYNLTQQTLNVKYHNTQYAELIYNQCGDVEYAIGFVGHEAKLIQVGNKKQRPLFHFTQHDILSIHRFPQLKPKVLNNGLYLISSVKTDTLALYRFDNATQALERISTEDALDQGDIEQVIWDPQTQKPMAYYRAYHRRQHYGFVQSTQIHFDNIKQYITKDKDFEILSQSQDNQHWVVGVYNSQSVPEYIYYDVKAKTFKSLFFADKKINHIDFYKTQCVEIPTRDNKAFPAYFTPTHQTNAPLVILIHGGPHSREFWGWLPVHQWFAHLGFHSLSVNYRGSVGMGRSHLEIANGEWAGRILDDIHDARAWAIAQKHTQAHQVALFGNSFGGYATMMSLLQTPDDFACGVDQMGPGDLIALIQQLPPGWQVNQALINQILALDIDTDAGKQHAKDISPVTHLHKLTKPLLMGYGGRDPIIHPNQAIHITDILKQKNIPVSCLMFENQGHQILDEKIRQAWLNCVALFLKRYLYSRENHKALSLPKSISVIIDNFNLVDRMSS